MAGLADTLSAPSNPDADRPWAMMGRRRVTARETAMSAARRWGRVLRLGLVLGLVSAPMVAPAAVAADPRGRLLVLLSGSTSMRDTVGVTTKAATPAARLAAFVEALPADGQVALRTYGTSKAAGDARACQDTKRDRRLRARTTAPGCSPDSPTTTRPATPPWRPP